MNDLRDLYRLTRKLENRLPLSAEEEARLEKLKEEFRVDENGGVTKTALAKLLGVHPNTITKWAKEGMPVEDAGGFRPDRVLQWRGVEMGIDDDEEEEGDEEHESDPKISPKVFWEVQFRQYRAMLTKVQYQREMGELIPRAEVVAMLVDRAVEFKKALLGRGRRLSLRLAHKEAQECQRILDEDSLVILETYSRENTIIGKPRPPVKVEKPAETPVPVAGKPKRKLKKKKAVRSRVKKKTHKPETKKKTTRPRGKKTGSAGK